MGQQLLRKRSRLRMGALEEPGGCVAVGPHGRSRGGHVPDAHDPSKRHTPVMLTTDQLARRSREAGPRETPSTESCYNMNMIELRFVTSILHRIAQIASEVLGKISHDPAN